MKSSTVGLIAAMLLLAPAALAAGPGKTMDTAAGKVFVEGGLTAAKPGTVVVSLQRLDAPVNRHRARAGPGSGELPP